MKTQIKRKDLLSKYQLLADLMDNIPDVIYFKDKKGRLVLVNKAHAQGLGLRPEEVAGKTDFDIFPKERAEMMARDDEYVMKTGKPIIDKIERATRTDGVDNYVSTTKIPRYDEKGKVIGLIGITRDITKRMHLERLGEEKAKVEKKLAVLQELDKMKSEFVSVVSHELRTPLAIIKEAVMLTSEGIAGPVTDKQKKILTNVKTNVERLNKLISDLLDMSRIERGRLKLRYSLVNLNDLFEESSDFFKRLAQERGISLAYALPRNQVNIFIDAERINQVITNLINNAIKFTEQPGRVGVEVRILENKVRIGVIDSGIGISKRDLPMLFNRFMQVSKSAEAEKKGLGLGLFITKELVEKHNGEIWVESKLGAGSKFYFTLPRFYTANVLDKHVRNRINNLLNKGISVYLLNVLIVNFRKFKKRIKIGPKKFFTELKAIIDETLRDSSREGQERPQIVVANTRNGEYSLLLPEATEKKAAAIQGLLKNKIQRYFIKNKIEGIFVNLAVLSYSPEGQPQTTQGFLNNLNIKKVCIGLEVRRFVRVNYKADVDILLAEGKTELTQTLDISKGGLCLMSRSLLKTDAQVGLRLKLPIKKEPLRLKGRVAWIRNIEGPVDKYKIGLEFVKLTSKDKKALSRFIRGVSGAAAS